MLPGGEIQPKPFVSDVRERVANQPSDIFGSGMSLVVEGEVMQPRPGHMGSVELQTNFHPLWSEGMQLYWKEFKPGDKLSLVFDSEVEGTYYAKIQFTVAPDYGTFALRVNDKVITPEVMLIVCGSVLVFGVIITWLCAYLSINKYLRMRANTLYYI